MTPFNTTPLQPAAHLQILLHDSVRTKHTENKPVLITLFPLLLVGPENIQVDLSPSQEVYDEGSDVILTCSVDSRPPAQFSWILNEALLPDAGPELRLMNVQWNQSGNYICQSFNSGNLRHLNSEPLVIAIAGKY